METSSGKVVIVLSESSPKLTALGKLIELEFKARKFPVECRSARDTFIPNLAPCDLFLFGAVPGESLETGDYRELNRSFRGVNFAGRKGAFFTVDGPGAFKKLKAMVKDSDLAVLEPGLSLSDEKDGKGTVVRWVDHLLKQRQGV